SLPASQRGGPTEESYHSRPPRAGGNCLPHLKIMAYDHATPSGSPEGSGSLAMTMLDRMRRHRNWLKWSLGLVCLAFVIFYIPDFLRGTGADAAAGDTVARIESQEITAGEFRRIYQAQLQAYRTAYGGQMSDQLLRQLGIDQQILQQLVDERAALAEASRLGIRVSDEEVRQRILTMPSFQQNGQFIGERAYQ